MITLRPARPEDLPQMMDLAHHAFTASQWSKEVFERLFAQGHGITRLVLVAEESAEKAGEGGSRIVGFLAGRESAGEWEIENIAVIASARRTGLGSRLLREFLHQIQSSGGREVFLEVRESNKAARALYEKWAFQELGRRKQYYTDPVEDGLIMKLSLVTPPFG